MTIKQAEDWYEKLSDDNRILINREFDLMLSKLSYNVSACSSG